MASLISRALPAALQAAGVRRRAESEQATLAYVEALRHRSASFEPPLGFERRVALGRRTDAAGRTVFTVRPRDGWPASRVVYAHGGSWTNEIRGTHWKFIAALVEQGEAEVVVPIYPLVQAGGTAATVVPWFAELTERAMSDAGSRPDAGRDADAGGDADAGSAARAGDAAVPPASEPLPTMLMGDSAGATIALAAARLLAARGLAVPTVLISPAVDLALDDPAIARIAPSDPWLAVNGLRVTARLWRGDLAVDDPIASPLYGGFDGLGPITVFTGTRDLLHADALRLAAAARAAGHRLELHVGDEQLHVYPFLPTPEGRAAKRRIIAMVRAAGR